MSNALPLQAIHHVELLVGNAKQASYFYRKAFGFSQLAYAGPETGVRDQASYVLVQNDIRLVLTTPLSPDDPMSEHLKKHGDGVLDIAFRTSDLDKCVKSAVERGAECAVEPHEKSDANGRIRRARIRTYGDTVHSFIECDDYAGPFLPGYKYARIAEPGIGLKRIDHCVGNVEDGKMDYWVDFYSRVLGFNHFMTFDDKDISTEYSALRSKVMAEPHNLIKMPINEPAEGRRKSQIQEYLDFNKGPGVQHVAISTDDILHTVSCLARNGVELMKTPAAYYDAIWERVGDVKEDHEEIRKLNILVDCDERGYLLQIFTRPAQDRPTLFYEIIQREGCEGFGKGNFKALFEAIEREQAQRGNL